MRDMNTKSCVHRINCNSCEEVYYGQNGRNIARAKERAKVIIKGNRETLY